jgi:hypothetical protein
LNERKTDREKDRQREGQTERKTDREKDRQRERQTERKTDREKDRQRERQTERTSDRENDIQRERQTDTSDRKLSVLVSVSAEISVSVCIASFGIGRNFGSKSNQKPKFGNLP